MADVVVKGVDQTTGRSREPVTADILLIDAETIRGAGNLTIDADALTMASTVGDLSIDSTGGITMTANASGATINLLAPAGASTINLGTTGSPTVNIGSSTGSTLFGSQFSWLTGLGAIQQILGPSDQQLRIASNGNNLTLIAPSNREIILDASAASSGLNFLANGAGGYFVMDVGDGGFGISTSSAATMVFSDSLSISQTSGAGTLSITGQGNMTFGSTSANVAVSIQSSNATGAVINVGTTGTPTINIAGATALLGYFGTAAAAQQAVAALTNNITSGGTNDQLDDYTDLTTYATDAAAIRNNLYQLGRKLDQVVDALRLYGLLG